MTTTALSLPKPDKRPNIPNPDPIQLNEVEWVVLTPERLPEGDNWVYFSMTPRTYETLARNQAEILRWVKEAQWRLNYYRGEDLPDDQGNSGGNSSSD